MKRSLFISAVLLSSSSLLVVACEGNSQQPAPPPEVVTTPPAVVDAGTTNVIDAGKFSITSPKPGFQTKSAAQLLSSFKACFGPSALMITADMIQADASPQVAVLGGTFAPSSAVGVNDIVTVQKAAFDGDDALLRLGTRADALSLEYVTAQRNVANVIAKNCSGATPGALCACASMPDATAMMRRCLPQFDPGSPPFLEAAQKLQTRCSTKPAEAIASLVASAALSKLP